MRFALAAFVAWRTTTINDVLLDDWVILILGIILAAWCLHKVTEILS